MRAKAVLRLTTRALHWDRGRPARSERGARTVTSEIEIFGGAVLLAALGAGGTPAVPVKSSNG